MLKTLGFWGGRVNCFRQIGYGSESRGDVAALPPTAATSTRPNRRLDRGLPDVAVRARHAVDGDLELRARVYRYYQSSSSTRRITLNS
jgi:hypothetical protein